MHSRASEAWKRLMVIRLRALVLFRLFVVMVAERDTLV
jgi:hypothetical protein